MSSRHKTQERLKALEAHREEQRRRLDNLVTKKNDIQQEIQSLEVVLESLDGEIDKLEELLIADEEGGEEGVGTVQDSSRAPGSHITQTQADEHLTDPTTQTQPLHQPIRPAASRVSLESTQLIETPSQTQFFSEGDEESYPRRADAAAALPRPRSSGGTFGQLEFTTIANKKKKAAKPKATGDTNGIATIDNFFKPTASAPTIPPPDNPHASAAPNSNPHSHTNQYNNDYNFPWSAQIQQLLQNTFRIQNFREHQREVINETLAGRDVFVLMRTGGGKSLTYQLPALFERPKVTLVISPLLSLIKDQEDQMNQFAPGSAVSFTSNLSGGQSEHARRWNLVRDPNQGVCLVFVTPEKVHKSMKLKSELQKLHQQNRLGRFVIDEAHCCSNWGHDFRPDYTKLGLLRVYFPNVPILAVTATASERVRQDVCDILNIPRNCLFYRSTANRPNLTYEVRPKKSSGEAVLDDMTAFIKEKFPSGAGIIYTFSRKDADTVADKLVERGVVAESYHSDVSPGQKSQIHQNWMANRTQVVVATIAFGLGINKLDVRFVLHHTISKTLEAYYQESGRAGRDGKAAQCILYYSPRDVTKMLKMVNGESRGARQAFWQMCRYAQESGNDEVCRSILLTALGEPGMNYEAAQRRQEEEGSIERRDVARHATTVLLLLQSKQNSGEKVTLNMLVKDWRAKPDNALPCVKANPPGPDLNTEECERVIISLLIERIIDVNIQFTAYDSVVYLKFGHKAAQLLASPDPKVLIPFPKREKIARKSQGNSSDSKKKKARQAVADDEGWISTKPAAKKARRSSTKGAGSKKKSGRTGASKSTQSVASQGKAKVAPKKKKAANENKEKDPMTEIIELSSSEESAGERETATSRPRRKCVQPPVQEEGDFLWDDKHSDEENEFTG